MGGFASLIIKFAVYAFGFIQSFLFKTALVNNLVLVEKDHSHKHHRN